MSEFGARKWCFDEMLKVNQELGEFPELTHRNWMDYVEDRQFGPEIQFIWERAFGDDFTYNHGSFHNISIGRRSQVFELARPGLRVFTAPSDTRSLFETFPFRAYKAEELNVMTFDFLARDLWCISKGNGVWRLGSGRFLSSLDDDFNPWPLSMAAGEGGLGWSPLDQRSAEEKAKTGNFLVVVTLGIIDRSKYVTVHFDIVKPPKNSLGQ